MIATDEDRRERRTGKGKGWVENVYVHVSCVCVRVCVWVCVMAGIKMKLDHWNLRKMLSNKNEEKPVATFERS